MSVNKALILGRLGKDPIVKYIGRGDIVANFTVATSEQWVDKNAEKKEQTQWHNIVVWGKVAEACGRNLSKGSQVFVEGKLETRSYEKDGSKHYITEIKAQRVEFLDRKPTVETSSELEYKFDPPIPTEDHSDLPF